MAQIAGTTDTFDLVGTAEDIESVIYDISPTDTPYFSMCQRKKASATYHQWQVDSLAAHTQLNAVVEGDDAAYATAAPTVMYGNCTQIARKTVLVSETADVVRKYGRARELARLVTKKGKELKRDIEAVLTDNNARVAGGTGTAPETAGLGAWIATNDSLAGDGASPTGDGSDARTDGTQRAFTEDMLKSVMSSVWTAGGNPSVLMVGAFNKQKVSGFAGIAAQRYMAPADGPTTIIGAADVYLSDFGQLSVVPNRFQRARDAWVLDTEMAAVCNLRPIQKVDLAKTGDASKAMLIWEGGLEVSNEAAHGLIADLTTA